MAGPRDPWWIVVPFFFLGLIVFIPMMIGTFALGGIGLAYDWVKSKVSPKPPQE